MRDDDRIMRDVKKIPGQTRREAQMKIREQELGLVPLSGEPGIINAVRDARYNMMQDLFRQWDYIYDHDRWGQWIVRKPGLLGDIARLLARLRKRKDAEFWFKYRDSDPDEMFLSELFKLKPIMGDSPLMADARRARRQTLRKLLDLKLITGDDVTPVFKWLDWMDPFGMDSSWAMSWGDCDDRLAMRAENKNYKAIKKIAKTLTLQSAQFWYAHKDFEIRELVERHFPDAQNRSKRASALWRFAFYLTISAVFWRWLVQLFSGGAWGLCCLMPPLSLCAMATLVLALKKLFSVRRNRGGRWLSGKSKEW